MSKRISVAVQFVLLTLALHGQLSAQSTCIAPPSGLVSWWTADTDETDLYNVNNPSAVNAISLVPGEVSNGFTFGSGGYIDIPASKKLANQKFTWAAWVRPDGPGPNNDQYGSIIVVQSIDNSTASIELSWRATDNRFIYLFGYIGTEIIGSNDTFPPGTFYFVAATYDGATFNLYVNGVLEASYAEKKTIAYSSRTWDIGSSDALVRGEGYPRTWNGVIDEVQAFKVALPASTLLSIYNAGIAGQCKDPVLALPATLSFKTQAVGTTSKPKTVTVTNNRSVAVAMDGFTFAGVNPGDFGQSSTTCGGTLKARKTCKVKITFTPDTTGSRSAILDVNDSAVGSPQTVNLSGTGK